jgi:hypothetical protein
MRKLLLSSILFLILSGSVQADTSDYVTMGIVLDPVQLFTVNNIGPLTFTYDQFFDFGVSQDIGDINYDLVSNTGWEVKAMILDASGDGQTPDDWDDENWMLFVNGFLLDEGGTSVIDMDLSPVNRDDAVWEVLLSIPWPVGPSTADCQIELTASTL